MSVRVTRKAKATRTSRSWTTTIVEDDARREEWRTALKGTIFEGLIIDITTQPPNDLAQKSTRLELYFKCLERQDELFAIAVNLIRKSLRITDNSELVRRAADLSTRDIRNHAANYILDVVKFVQLVDGGSPTTRGIYTKIQEIFLAEDGEPLPTVLLYPARFSNVLLRVLGNILQLTLADVSTLAATIHNPSAQPILAAQFESYGQAFAYTYTARSLRDGFYLAQTVTEFRRIMIGDAAGRDPNVIKIIDDATGDVKGKCKDIVLNKPPVLAARGARRSLNTIDEKQTRIDTAKDIDEITVNPAYIERVPSVLVTRQNRTGEFWLELVKEMAIASQIERVEGLFDDVIDRPDKSECPSTMLLKKQPWAKLIARIYRFYAMNPSSPSPQRALLQLLAGRPCNLSDIPESSVEEAFSPDADYLEAGVTVRGVEYGNLAKRMRTSTLQFILQLTFNIDKALAAAATTTTT